MAKKAYSVGSITHMDASEARLAAIELLRLANWQAAEIDVMAKLPRSETLAKTTPVMRRLATLAREDHQLAMDIVAELDGYRRYAEAEIERLRVECQDLADDAFRQIAFQIMSGPRKGWWDTCGLTTARDLGDRLVEVGTWERHPDGVGRRWFYRPLERPESES